jgi:hypothetical protein
LRLLQECESQLTLLNFSQLKGVLFCKPHFIQVRASGERGP